MSGPHWQISTIIKKHVEQLEEHATRVGAIVDQAQTRFNADYTAFVASFGAVSIAGSIGIALAGVSAAVSVTGIVVGGIAMSLAMTYRYLSRHQQVRLLRGLAEIEEQRLKSLRRAATMDSVGTFGLPDGTPLAQLQLLLGDQPTMIGRDDSQATWRALPSTEGEDMRDETEAA